MKIKFFLFCFISITSLNSYSQENCFNGIDDNGNGLIDLNDPLCNCNQTTFNSLIPNPSFENYSILPTSFSQLNRATPWVQASTPTSDYFHSLGYSFPGLLALTYPFPDGNGIAGGFFENNWKEYLGAVLINPLSAGNNYQLKINIASVAISGVNASNINNMPNLEPVNITIYGKSNNPIFPLNTLNDPVTFDPSWVVLGQLLYTPNSSWGEITINFTPTVSINAVMIGAPINLPSSYPNHISPGATSFRPYFLYDNLRLNTPLSFGASIFSSGDFCNNNLVLTASPNIPTLNYQWYFNGVAISGATNSTYNVPFSTNNSGQYRVRVYNSSECNNSSVYNITDNLITPTFTQIQPICAGETLNQLPTTSNNGILGTWSPTLNNTLTTTYTFTPNPGQCATPLTMQIVVNPIITPVFNDFGTLCYGSNFQLPGISNNNILGVWSLSFNNLTTDTYTFTPNSNFCSVPITITTTIRPDFDFDFRIYCVNENLNIEVVAINNSINLNTASFSWSFDTIILDNPNKIFDLTFYKESTITTEVLPHLLTITITDENGCEKAKELTISNDYCKIQKGISVDENDLNDFFDLSLLNVKKLSVFNRYGMKVFDKVNYKDEWKGQTHEGNILPSGVYYYIIEFNENIEPKTGWIYLLK